MKTYTIETPRVPVIVEGYDFRVGTDGFGAGVLAITDPEGAYVAVFPDGGWLSVVIAEEKAVTVGG